ncbi:GntR family transcriptional regulator [Actinoplanes auranticolor]|uniref:GntR family transcriptional regulator n=1 Tax=Actinoplanes auranticolor TaxID=47988 RepID=A0A919S884_9ACTN|nr:GntR family transcriptional regulator [Actinoplanes auranticolor]GIM66900.1 GntR family transcriptional regulator [Actinoplanes auranticolor]
MTPARPAPPVHATLADAATARLHEAILVGELAGGAALRLTDLATSMGMSMMPVREAIRRLEALGLVEVIPHRGAWVRELSIEDAHDTHDMRMLLEVTAIERAAARFTDQDAERARAFLQRNIQALELGDQAAARQAHTDYHFAMYAAARSRWLLRALEPVWQNGERYRFAGTRSPGARAQIMREHEAILAACVAHDPAAAATALRGHIDNAHARVIEKMTPGDGDRPA